MARRKGLRTVWAFLGILASVVAAGLCALWLFVLITSAIFPNGYSGGPGTLETANKIFVELLFGGKIANEQRAARFAPEQYFTGPMLEAGRAVIDDNDRRLAAALDHGANKDAVGKEGMTLVALAVHMQSPRCLMLLAQRKAQINVAVMDPDASDSDAPPGATPLSFAIARNNLPLGRALLEAGADARAHLPGERIISGESWAIYSGDPALLALAHRAAKNDGEGSDAARKALAAQARSVPHSAMLIHAIDTAAIDINHWPDFMAPITGRSAQDDVAWLELLTAHGASVDAVNDDNNPALATAYHSSQYRMVAWLLEKGANPYAPYHTYHGPKPVMPLLLKDDYARFEHWFPEKYGAARGAAILERLKPYASERSEVDTE